MSDHSTPLGGACSARFDPLRELFAAKLESGEDLGASLAVIVDGVMVVDLWGGWADEARTAPWAGDTITGVFSTTKTMTSLAALVLVDRGELDLDANVATYGPEFAARGKGGIKVRHLLSHTSGVSGWDQPITVEDLYDWDSGVRLLSPKTIDRIFEVQSDGIDLVLSYRLKIGAGYGLPWPEVLPFVPQGRVCFGTGAGGSLVLADADRRLTVSYVMNKMALPGPNLIVSPIAAALVERVYDIVNR